MVVSSRRPRICGLPKSISRRNPQLKTVLVIAATTLSVSPSAASLKRLATFFWKVVFLILVRALALFADDGELLLDPLLFVVEPLFVQVPGACFTHMPRFPCPGPLHHLYSLLLKVNLLF